MREIKLESCFIGRLALSAIDKMKENDILDYTIEDYEDLADLMRGKKAKDLATKRNKSISWARYKKRILTMSVLGLIDEMKTLKDKVRELIVIVEKQSEELNKYKVYEGIDDVFKRKAGSLSLSRHTTNILFHNNYTILDVVKMSPVEFKSIKNLGGVALAEMDYRLSELGLKFGMTEVEILNYKRNEKD